MTCPVQHRHHYQTRLATHEHYYEEPHHRRGHAAHRQVYDLLGGRTGQEGEQEPEESQEGPVDRGVEGGVLSGAVLVENGVGADPASVADHLPHGEEESKGH